MTREPLLQAFLDAALAAFDRAAEAPQSRRSLREIADHLRAPQPARTDGGRRLPVCGQHLETALAVTTGRPWLDLLIERFRDLEPMLDWRPRTGDASASENFAEGHANTMIVGPGGLEERRDVWLGVSLLAPHVRYPDHDHAPEETYLVLSDSEFMHGDSGWFSPGIGGSFYNPPGIRHAMRAGDTPLFAFWALLPGRAK